MENETRDVVVGLVIISATTIIAWEVSKKVYKRAKRVKLATVIPFRSKEQEKAS
jgi:hypothetical protein